MREGKLDWAQDAMSTLWWEAQAAAQRGDVVLAQRIAEQWAALKAGALRVSNHRDAHGNLILEPA